MSRTNLNRATIEAEQAEARRSVLADLVFKPAPAETYTYAPTTSLPPIKWRDGWPDCARCGHSMTGVYNGKPNCNRCSSARRLNG